MDEDLRPDGPSLGAPPPWRAVEAIPVVLIALAGAFVGGALVAVLFARQTAILLAALVFEVCLAGATLLWALSVRRGGAGDLGLSTRDAARDAGYGFLAGAVLFVLTAFVIGPLFYALIGLFTSQPVTPPQQEVLPTGPTGGQVAIGAVVAILAAPIAEELFFRGFLYRALRGRMRFWVAALLSGAIFGVFHPPPLLMPLLVVVGVGLAWVYERRGSLVPCIAAHAAFNIIGYSFIVQASS